MHGKGVGNATMIVWSKSGRPYFLQRHGGSEPGFAAQDPARHLPGAEHHAEQHARFGDAERPRDEQRRRRPGGGAGQRTSARRWSTTCTLPRRRSTSKSCCACSFAELDRQKEEQYGINLLAIARRYRHRGEHGTFSPPSLTGTAGTTVGGASAGGAAVNAVSYTISQALNIFAFNPSLNLGAFIKALQSNNILQILAEPNLVTTNGKEASFLVGGEFPVPILQGGANSGAVTVQFNEFGIRLRFTPVMTRQQHHQAAPGAGSVHPGHGQRGHHQRVLDSGARHAARRNRCGTGRGAKLRGGRAAG